MCHEKQYFVYLCHLVGHGSFLSDRSASLLSTETDHHKTHTFNTTTHTAEISVRRSKVTHLAKPMKSSWFVLMYESSMSISNITYKTHTTVNTQQWHKPHTHARAHTPDLWSCSLSLWCRWWRFSPFLLLVEDTSSTTKHTDNCSTTTQHSHAHAQLIEFMGFYSNQFHSE